MFKMIKKLLCLAHVPAMLVLMLLLFATNLDFTMTSKTSAVKKRLFESYDGFKLVGHVMETLATDELGCGLRCLRNDNCRSYNSYSDGNHGNTRCELSNQTRQSRPDNLLRSPGTTYHGKDIKGWYPSRPAHSCKDIRDLRDSKGDGWYWIDPEKNGNPLKVYCDMTTDGGGWLRVTNVVFEGASPPQVSVQTSYRVISSDQMVIKKSAMEQLRTHLDFTRLRFHCSKERTFHVTTVANDSGEAVVKYFSGQTNVQPDSCGSFVRMKDDNSMLPGVCATWGQESGLYDVGKWGHGYNEDRLYNHPAFKAYYYHWVMSPSGSRWNCDDHYYKASDGNFWKIFVR